MRRLMLLCAALAYSSAGLAADARGQLEAFLKGLNSMSAQFQQRVLDENGKLVETSGGVFYVERPGKFRWSYKEPYPQEIIGARERVWVYDSELEQVSIKPMGDALGNSPALLLTSDRPLDELFDVADLGTYNHIDWVEMKPRGEEASFVSFRVGMENGSLRVMELLDSFGQRTQLSFGDIRRNPELPDGLFTFQAPAGADVIGNTPATQPSD